MGLLSAILNNSSHSSHHPRKGEFDLPGEFLGSGSFGSVSLVTWNLAPIKEPKKHGVLSRNSSSSSLSLQHQQHNQTSQLSTNPNGAVLEPRKVALKIVEKEKVQSKSVQRDIMDAVKKIKHPHVVQLHDWFETDRQFWMAFDPAMGGELYDEIERRKTMEEWEVRYIMTDLISAIAHVHSLHIIHRDIKPENIFLKSKPLLQDTPQRYHVMLADFGVCYTQFRMNDPEELVQGPPRGSPGYTPPEVYAEQGYDYGVDVWACGVITNILLAGRFPFWELAGIPFIMEARKGIHTPSKASGPCKELLKRMLEFERKKRISAKDALEAAWIKEEPILVKDFAEVSEVEGKEVKEEEGKMNDRQTTVTVNTGGKRPPVRQGSMVERKQSLLVEIRAGV